MTDPVRSGGEGTGLDLARLREVAEAATAGPWFATDNDRVKSETVTWPEGDPRDVAGCAWNVGAVIEAGKGIDARFIATFDPPTVLALLDRVFDPVTARDTIARALGEHAPTMGFYGDNGNIWRSYACTCGWFHTTADQESDWKTHRDDELLAALASQERG